MLSRLTAACRNLAEQVLSCHVVRQWTDRPVRCQVCGEHLGYMTFAHRRQRWLCSRHASAEHRQAHPMGEPQYAGG